MKIKFKVDCELEVVETYDEVLDEVDSSMETFKAGEIVEIDIFGRDEDANTVDIQFGDGDVALSLDCDWFEEIKDDECAVDSDGCLKNNEGDAETDLEG